MSKTHRTFGKGAKTPPVGRDILVWAPEWNEWSVDVLQEHPDGELYWYNCGCELEEKGHTPDPMRYTHWRELPKAPAEKD